MENCCRQEILQLFTIAKTLKYHIYNFAPSWKLQIVAWMIDSTFSNFSLHYCSKIAFNVITIMKLLQLLLYLLDYLAIFLKNLMKVIVCKRKRNIWHINRTTTRGKCFVCRVIALACHFLLSMLSSAGLGVTQF